MTEAVKSPLARKLYYLWMGLAVFALCLLTWEIAAWQRWIAVDPPFRPLTSISQGVSQLCLALGGVASYRNWAKTTSLMMFLAFAAIVCNVAATGAGR